jgi:hypothetical protein
MARKVKGPSFDPNLLLAKTGRGRTKLEYRTEEVIFSQGEAADSIFLQRRPHRLCRGDGAGGADRGAGRGNARP